MISESILLVDTSLHALFVVEYCVPTSYDVSAFVGVPLPLKSRVRHADEAPDTSKKLSYFFK